MASKHLASGLLGLTLGAIAACGGGGQYGYARTYQPLGREEEYMERAAVVSYEDVRRDPEEHKDQLLGWFGVVTDIDVAPSGKATVQLNHRTHQDRHLCGNERASSCRVTVSERPGGAFTIELSLKPEELSGPNRIWVGSLIKVYGTTSGEEDDKGDLRLEPKWYRHWPRGKYVTTGSAGVMRR